MTAGRDRPSITPALFKTRPATLEALRTRYAEPHRRYHCWSHVEHMLSEYVIASSMLRLKEAVLLAIYYHDAVYDAASSTNEENSAALLRQDAGGEVSDDLIGAAAAFILATRKHVIEPSLPDEARTDCAAFLDIDMAILGADAPAYVAYARNIRLEYSMFPDAIYQAGRLRVLEGFLDRPSIYLTPSFMARLEAQARKNLAGEIELLRSARDKAARQ